MISYHTAGEYTPVTSTDAIFLTNRDALILRYNIQDYALRNGLENYVWYDKISKTLSF